MTDDSAPDRETHRRDEEGTREALAEGETVRTELFEHAAVESEVVESEVVDRTVVERELLDRDVAGVAVAGCPDGDRDADRLPLGSGDVDVVEDVALAVDLEEVRSELVEVDERKTVESRVVEAEAAEVDVSVEGVEEHVVDSRLVAAGADAGGGVDGSVESERVDEGTVRSEFVERRTVERDVAEEKTLTALVTDVDAGSATVTHERPLAREVVDVAAFDAATGGTSGASAAVVDVTDDDRGKDVVTPAGEDVGIVSDVDPDADVLYVDPDPSLTDRVAAGLHWGDEDDAYSLAGDRIETIEGDRVVVDPEAAATSR